MLFPLGRSARILGQIYAQGGRRKIGMPSCIRRSVYSLLQLEAPPPSERPRAQRLNGGSTVGR
eukprot:7616531-Pyramimonas_sp.AAC.1